VDEDGTVIFDQAVADKRCRSADCPVGQLRCDPDQDKAVNEPNVCCSPEQQCVWNRPEDTYACIPQNPKTPDGQSVCDDGVTDDEKYWDGDHYCKTVDEIVDGVVKTIHKCCRKNEICVPDPLVDKTCLATGAKLCNDGPTGKEVYQCVSFNPASVCCGGDLGIGSPVCCQDYQECIKIRGRPKCVTPNN